MSRANVAKSRADKAGKTTSAPTPAVTHEIVPGKCNDQDWNLMLDHDDGDDFILDVVEEVVDNAMAIIYKNYLDRQLIPYTVTQAKDALLQIIEWQYLSSDVGEPNMEQDASWMEDEEPEPAMTDCWAQGSVPRLRAPVTPRTDELEDVSEEAEEREGTPMSEQEEEAGEAGEESIPETSRTSDTSGSSSSRSSEGDVTEDRKGTKKEYKRRNVKFRPYRGKLKSAGTGNMTESLAETEMIQMISEMSPVPPKTPDTVMLQMPNSCHSIVKSVYEDQYTCSSPRLAPQLPLNSPPENKSRVAKLQTGRPPGIRDVVYDESGNVIAVSKVNPNRLPTHRVKTGYQVIDPQVEASQARLEAMRTGRRKQGNATSKTSPRVVNIVAARKSGSDVKAPPGTLPMGRVKEGVTPLPPPLIEVMDVAPGVVVREGDRMKKGPKQHPRRAELVLHATNRTLQPMRGKANLPTVMVTEIIGHTSPIIKPLGDNRPIPPISPQC